jgi:hypothetical protein
LFSSDPWHCRKACLIIFKSVVAFDVFSPTRFSEMLKKLHPSWLIRTTAHATEFYRGCHRLSSWCLFVNEWYQLSFFNSHSGGWSPNGSTRHVGHWMAYCTCPGWLWWWRIWWNEEWQGKPKYSEKTCPIVSLSTTNPTWPDPGANPGRRGGKPGTNSLSYGAVTSCFLKSPFLS